MGYKTNLAAKDQQLQWLHFDRVSFSSAMDNEDSHSSLKGAVTLVKTLKRNLCDQGEIFFPSCEIPGHADCI